ncbi:unnamed protein product [Adineta steineri]|uniref:PID domain-containing protein n=1 Tax=Adineta steineri TaxID=433720 RepID=A0A818J428_9BILA|nr:unnamed protein product [Adineta steineri]CAF3534872.1 unnamed protein product [Adineta steineri]
MTDTIAAAAAATTPTTPTTPPTAVNGSNAKKFDGEGAPFKGKLIGMEDLSIDRDEKICLDSMFKLKAVVKARGEHKQRIQLNLTMSAVKIFDDTTKALIASHEIERISFVVIDPRDTRAFGYIFNTSDDRHQFWAIKTERAAAATVLALKELFEMAFEQLTSGEKGGEDSTKVTTPAVTTPTQQVTQVAPVSSPPPTTTPAVTPAAPSLLDGNIWEEPVAPAAPPKTESNSLLWDMNDPVVPVTQTPQKPVDSLGDIFGNLSFTTPLAQPPAPTNNNNLLFNAFPNPTPQQQQPLPPTNQYNNFYAPPVQPNLLNPNSTLYQQPQRPITPVMPTLLLPQQPQQQQQQQPNFASPPPVSSVAPPAVTSPFADLDIFGGLSSPATTKTTKESFFPTTTTVKTIQQLQTEKQAS